MHRVKVSVVEDALDANNTIARANRDDFDRHDVAVVNLMSAPGAGKTALLERVLGGSATCAPACSRATSRAATTPTGSRACTYPSPSSTPATASAASATSTRTWSRSALPALPLATSTSSSSRTSATSSARPSSTSASMPG